MSRVENGWREPNGMLWQLALSTEGHKRRTTYSDL